ncbi:MAG: hypothetical protein ACLQAT_29560 [Candidatus Binataceae bacterium]
MSRLFFHLGDDFAFTATPERGAETARPPRVCFGVTFVGGPCVYGRAIEPREFTIAGGKGSLDPQPVAT